MQMGVGMGAGKGLVLVWELLPLFTSVTGVFD